MESQLATLATDTGTTFAKLFQVEGIQTILFKFWAFRAYTLNNLTPIRLFCVKGRFSGLSGIKTDHVWPEIRPLGFKGLSIGIKEFILNLSFEESSLKPSDAFLCLLVTALWLIFGKITFACFFFRLRLSSEILVH